MIRITNIPEEKNASVNTDEPKSDPIQLGLVSKSLLQILAITIADHAASVAELLDSYSVELSPEPDEKELTDKLLEAVCQHNAEFNAELAQIILDASLGSSNDKLDVATLFKGANDSFAGEGGPAGLINGITGAISGVANAIGSTRSAREQATANTLQSIYAYKTQAAAAASKDTKQDNKGTKLLLLIGLFLLIGIAVAAMVSYAKNQQTKQPSPLNT